MKEEKIRLITFFIFILFTIAVIILSLVIATYQQKIDAERDAYGCLAPAGYSWDSNIVACTRDWELETEGKKRAANLAVQEILKAHDPFGLTISDVSENYCEGCYTVRLENKDESFTVELDNWEPKDQAKDEADNEK